MIRRRERSEGGLEEWKKRREGGASCNGKKYGWGRKKKGDKRWRVKRKELG